MPHLDILDSKLKMCSILHRSKMYPFESGVFKFQGRRLCILYYDYGGKTVFPCVFGNVVSLGYGLQL